MKTTRFKTALILAVVARVLPAASQQRPSSPDQYPPNPPANNAEVRFAMGKEPITCKRFQLTVKGGGADDPSRVVCFGLKAFAHEDAHVVDMNAAHTKVHFEVRENQVGLSPMIEDRRRSSPLYRPLKRKTTG